MDDFVTIGTRTAELIARHGSYRAAARVLQIDSAYFWRLHTGEKTNPSDAVLKKLGLRKVTLYTRSRK